MRGASRGDPEVEQPGQGGAGDVAFVLSGAGTGARPGIGRAAPAGGVRSPVLGRSRPAVRRHYDRLPLEGWTRCGRRVAKAVWIRVGQKLPVRARKNGSGDRNRRRWSAAWQARRSQGALPPRKADKYRCATRRSIPLKRGRTNGRPGAGEEYGRRRLPWREPGCLATESTRGVASYSASCPALCRASTSC